MNKTNLLTKLLLLCLCVVGSVNGVWADNITFTTTSASTTPSWSGTTSTSESGTVDGITVAFNKNSAGSSITMNKAYIGTVKGMTVVVSSTSKTFSKVVFSFSTKDYGPDKKGDWTNRFQASTGTLKKNSDTEFQWDGDATSSVTFSHLNEGTQADNNFRFTQIVVTTASATPPTLSSSDPANSASNVAINVAPELTYDKTLTLADGSKITMEDEDKNSVSITPSVSGAVLTVTPNANLSYSKTYTLTVAAGALSDGANVTTSADVISFTTKAAPSVGTISPNGGKLDGNTDVTITGNVGTVYYQWSESSTATIGVGDWTQGTATTVPNVTGDRYLHVYASDGVTNSAITTSTKFEVTKVKEAAGLAYGTTAVEKTIGDDAFTNGLTNPNSLSVSYSSSNTDVATVDADGEVTIKAAGETTITASSDATDDYYAGEASYTLTVNKKAHGLAYATATVYKETGADDFTNTLTNPNSLIIAYSSSNTDVATIDAETGEVTVKAAGSTTITATTDGNATFEAGTATYTLNVISLDPQADVTATTIWDWSEVTNSSAVDFSGTNLNNEDVLYSNISKYGFTAVSGLSSQSALLMNGQRAYNNANGSKHCQVNYLKFNTTVDGVVTIEYANTGGNPARTVVVNGTNGSKTSTANNSYQTESFEVTSGTVTIKGIQTADGDDKDKDKMLRIRKVIFQPTTVITVSSYGWATYITPDDVTFAEGDAFIVKSVNTTTGVVTIEGVTAAPKDTPVLLKGAGDKTITYATSTQSAPAGNILEVCDGTNTGHTSDYPYVLAKKDTGAGFKLWTGDIATLKDRVVLWLNEEVNAREFFFLDEDNTTTNIAGIETKKNMENMKFYNLNGQQVEAPVKGLYIVNGRKVVIK